MTKRLVPVLVAVVGTFLFHRYSILTGLDLVQADTGDSRFVAFLLEHWNNVLHGAAEWRSPPIFWPLQGTLAYSDTLLGMGLIHTALRPFLDVLAAANLQLILLTLATYAATYAMLGRGFRLSVWGASAGAAFFAFSWPRFAQLVHLQLQFTPPLPLLVLLLVEGVRDGLVLSRLAFAGRAVLAAVLFALLLWTTVYFALFVALGVAVALVLAVAGRRTRRQLGAVAGRQWPGLAAGSLALGVLVAPLVPLYGPVARSSGGRDWAEVSRFLPHPAHFFWMGRENWVWGWWFARWPQATLDANWAELRIGVGVVASVLWGAGIVWALWPGRRAVAVRLAVLTGVSLQVLMLAIGRHSAWWLVWRYVPGAEGVRAVSRLELVVTLAMAIWFGFLLDAVVRRGRPWAIAAVLVLFAGVAVEQFGSATIYSGVEADALSRRVAASLRTGCAADYVVAPPAERGPQVVVDEAQFDAGAYLAANPDVAANWRGTAWEHYQRFGRAEHRALDPEAVKRRHWLLFLGYNYTVPLAAALARRPVVNGLSGWQPPGWDLFDVFAPDPRERLDRWLARNGRATGSVCVVPVGITLEMMPFRPTTLWP